MSRTEKVDVEQLIKRIALMINQRRLTTGSCKYVYLGYREAAILKAGIPHDKFTFDEAGGFFFSFSNIVVEIIEVEKESHFNVC